MTVWWTAFLAFMSTNIDDILLLMLLFSQTRTFFDRARIVLGQYLGIAALFAFSVFGSLGTRFLPEGAVGILGLVPIALGVACFFQKEEEDEQIRGTGVLPTAFLALANGADNIGIYIPVFSGFGVSDFLVTALVFAVMTGLWCFFGYHIGAFPPIQRILRRYRRVIVPTVFILLGTWILIQHIFF